MSYDFKAKGAADFKAGKKDERLFHNPENHGRLYREGWHGARRDAASPTFPGDPLSAHRDGVAASQQSSSSPTGGTFVITAGGKTSEPIHFKAKPDVVAAALENLRKPDPAPAPEKPLGAPPGVPGAGEDGQLDLFG